MYTLILAALCGYSEEDGARARVAVALAQVRASLYQTVESPKTAPVAKALECACRTGGTTCACVGGCNCPYPAPSAPAPSDFGVAGGS